MVMLPPKNIAPPKQGISIPPAVKHTSTNKYAPLLTAKSQLSRNDALAKPFKNDINKTILSICTLSRENNNRQPPITTHKITLIDCKINPSVMPLINSLVFLPQYPFETPIKTVINKNI